ncbi:sensor histidine kinase [Sulfurospirillum arcachonense]|uniref:sensor histidine kinase n=1 Tax=Sulfurospirillum arcachonense TaxID=57666 RepID=UPI000468C059|nr:HAMP domain-containing sensor histidine kinase [Sulfurospirillum arcachonense]
MKLHQHFIINFLLIFVTTLLLTTAVSYFTVKEINLQQYKNFIKKEVELVKAQLPLIKNLDEFALRVKKATNNRLTVIDDDGVILAESDYDKKEMENHSDRREIKLSRANEDGYAVRHSKTIGIDFLYLASQTYYKEQPIFIRLSMKLNSISQEFYNMWIKLTIIFASSIFLGLYVFYKLSQKIEKEIGKVTNTLDEISNKNFKAVVNASFAKEFFTIESHIEKLARILEKRSKQKRKYTAKIKLISKQRSDIISAISHEFKNPIASVIGYAQTLMDDPNANTSIKERFLEKIIKNSHKISSMIDRLSLATKFENGDLSPKLTKFDLYNLTQDILSSFKDNNNDREFTCKGESYIVNADKTMIELVITNLIDNAVKYSHSDIHIEIENGTLHVKDTGIGIAPDEIEKVTNKFYRSNTLSWDNSIGLGLALVKYILNLHNSDLDIQSEVGVGSDFSFKIETKL